MHSLSALIFSV